VSALSALAVRETRGIDLADIDRAEAENLRSDGPGPTELVEGAV
jgi:hypothetical protein